MDWGIVLQIGAGGAHPAGEVLDARRAAAQAVLAAPLVVDTHGRRFHVEWDPSAPVTPLGQLVFFSQFLATAGLFHDWVKSCPLVFTSNNAPSLNDLLGTNTLAVLSGQHRYSHVTALRADTVNPAGFGMSKVCSQDSVRRAFAGADPVACALWQTTALRRTWLPALRHPWIMDMDATVKPLYGHQEGAEIGYNPHKPGRPSHVHHSLFVRGLRLVLDVEVHSGKQTSATHGREDWVAATVAGGEVARGRTEGGAVRAVKVGCKREATQEPATPSQGPEHDPRSRPITCADCYSGGYVIVCHLRKILAIA